MADKDMNSVRLIDANALIQEIRENNEGYYFNSSAEREAHFAKVDYAIDRISEAPTIEERLAGEWIKGPEIYRKMLGDTVLYIEYRDYTCSSCGLVLDRLLYHRDGSPFYKYCPNCGADMKGEDDG